jgi:hypothetical protein
VGQPRMNDERFYPYPMKRVVATLENQARCTAACHDLERAGIDLSEVDVLSGPEGARLLDRRGAGHGVLARLLRLLQRGAYEGNTLKVHGAALDQGNWVVYVPVRGKGALRNVVEVLRAHGGRGILYFRRWAVEAFPA